MKRKIDYSYEYAFLDQQYATTFTELCVKTKTITKDFLGEGTTYTGQPLRGMKGLLRNLVLFEKVDFSSSIWDCEQLIDRGLIPEKSICCSNQDPDAKYTEQAISIMSTYKADIIRLNQEIYKDELCALQSRYSPTRDFWKNKDSNTINTIWLKDNFYVDFKDQYSNIIRNLDKLETIVTQGREERLMNDALNGNAITNLAGIRDNLAYALQAVEERKAVYLTSKLNHMQGEKITNTAADLYAFVEAQLPNEVNVLPMPETLEDVWNMRRHPSVKTYRKVMNEWNHYLQEGDIDAVKKMKKDVIKANHGLERIGKCKRFLASPYTRTGICALGFIPIISEILNVSSFAEPYILNSLENKYSWTHLNEVKALRKK